MQTTNWVSCGRNKRVIASIGGFAVPRAAQQKGAVEQLVGWVKRSFLTCRRFHDRADLERQLVAWLTDVNTVRPGARSA